MFVALNTCPKNLLVPKMINRMNNHEEKATEVITEVMSFINSDVALLIPAHTLVFYEIFCFVKKELMARKVLQNIYRQLSALDDTVISH